jgi:predicted alpha/beta-fold hydrolase
MSKISGRKKILAFIKSYFKPETWKKIQQVERDYLKLFKGVITISTASLILFLIHRQIPYFNTYDLEYVNNEINKYIIEKIKPIDYRPTFYLPSCLAQMIFNEIISHPEIEYKREFIPTHDNGMISLDWVVKKDSSNIQPDKLLVILHGLTGGSESSYIKETAEIFNNEKDFKVVVVNYRGISNTPLLTPTFYHAGYTEDMYTAMKYIKLNYPNMKCYTLGTSMGGNILTKLFGSTDEFNEYVKGFVSVSNPLNCYEVEKRNRGKVLDFFLIQRQLGYVQKHHDILKDIIGKIFQRDLLKIIFLKTKFFNI